MSAKRVKGARKGPQEPTPRVRTTFNVVIRLVVEAADANEASVLGRELAGRCALGAVTGTPTGDWFRCGDCQEPFASDQARELGRGKCNVCPGCLEKHKKEVRS